MSQWRALWPRLGPSPRRQSRERLRWCRQRSRREARSGRPGASAVGPCDSPPVSPCQNCGAASLACRRPSRCQAPKCSAPESGDAADDRSVLGECPIAGERHELGDQPSDVIEAMWPFRVSRHLHLLPGGEARIGLAEQSVSSIFEPTHLVGDVDLGGGGKVPKLSNLALEFRDWPFEI